jgi:hypothetical protein
MILKEYGSPLATQVIASVPIIKERNAEPAADDEIIFSTSLVLQMP